MTAEEFADAIEKLITAARDEGLSDGVIIAGLEEAADAFREGLPRPLLPTWLVLVGVLCWYIRHVC
jgi:hypothetical protein